MESPDISVVVPCYNEFEGLGQLADALERLTSLCRDRDEQVEFILVDDGSVDGTGAALDERFGGRDGFTVLHHRVNRGVGAAMRTGFAAARGDIVVCYDADCAYPVEDVLRLVDAVRKGCDVATASPLAEEGRVEGVGLHRRLLSIGVARLYRLVLGRPARKIGVFSCAFRAYRRRALQAIHFESDGFPAASEILARMILQDFCVVEVPSVLSERRFGVSKMRKLETIRAHLRLLNRLARIRLGL